MNRIESLIRTNDIRLVRYLIERPSFFISPCDVNLIDIVSDNLEGYAFGEDHEWIRQLQGYDPLQQPQYRLPEEQNISINDQSSGTNDNDGNGNGPQHHIEQPKPLHETEQLQAQEPQQIPQLQGLDGFSQLQGADNIALCNIFQQQQQQQQYSSFSNNTNQTMHTNTYLDTTQALQQQIGSLHQLQHQQPQQQQQQMATSNLHESLLQLQKLQEQQQQILKNISNAGLMDPNALLNPIHTLLNSLIVQLDNTNGENNNNNIDNNHFNDATSLGAGTWDEIPDTQQLRMNVNDNSLSNNTVGKTHNLDPQIQPPQVGFAENKDLSQENQQLQQITLIKTLQASNNHNGFINNIDDMLAIDPSPTIRNVEKKREPKSFPKQLWDAMMTDGFSNDNAFEWLPDGKSFVVVDSDLFCTDILDRKFKQSKYGSFVRKLHRWGFIRLTSGTGTDCFHHPMFQRHKPDLVTQIKCNNRKGGKGKGHNPYARGDIQHSAQPSLMGVEKFIRAKVVSADSTSDITA